MEKEDTHFGHILLYYFNKGISPLSACAKIRKVYGTDAIQEKQCQNWFKQFRSGDFSVGDIPSSINTTLNDDDKIKALTETDRQCTTREIANALETSHANTVKLLERLGYINKLDIWVPRELEESNLAERLGICDSLIRREKNNSFLKRIITGDNKWISYSNVMRKRSSSKRDGPAQTTSNDNIDQKEIFLSIWWDWKGVLFYELLPHYQTINSDEFCRQMNKLKEAVDKKRPKLDNHTRIVFHHANAGPHTNLTTRKKLLDLGWDLLPHPPYSPDLAPSDYHLFRSLQDSLNEKTFNSENAVKEHLHKFFADKDRKFFERGIMELPERWQKVLENNGKYIDD